MNEGLLSPWLWRRSRSRPLAVDVTNRGLVPSHVPNRARLHAFKLFCLPRCWHDAARKRGALPTLDHIGILLDGCTQIRLALRALPWSKLEAFAHPFQGVVHFAVAVRVLVFPFPVWDLRGIMVVDIPHCQFFLEHDGCVVSR